MEIKHFKDRIFFILYPIYDDLVCKPCMGTVTTKSCCAQAFVVRM